MKLSIQNVFVHPEYNAQDKLNDIALIRLAENVNLTSNITVILPFHNLI
jgi:hypothetical protein